MKQLRFERILPRLLATYEEGRLVPFLGAGLSVDAAREWKGLVEGLERGAKIRRRARKQPESPASEIQREELVRRANTAVRRLRARDAARLAEKVRAALYEHGEAPAQACALARIRWPLVVTTNYDDCFVSAFTERNAPRKIDVLGRSPSDCQRVLSSLTEPSRSLLWAVQGYAGGPCHADPDHYVGKDRLAALEAQLVVGHDEYRRVTYRELHFRRAFAEVYRSRSLLFLGSGIRETYLQELFSEILETYGPSGRQHYALMIRDQVDASFVQFMRSRFQTLVVPYKEHAELPNWLGRLANRIDGSSKRATSWSFGSPRSRKKDDWSHVEELEVVRGPLPLERAAGECLAVSAGGSRHTWGFGRSVRFEVLGEWEVDPRRHRPKELSRYLGHYARQHVFAVRAKSDDDERGLQHIYRASRDLFRHAARLGYRRIRMQLLAAGGSEPPPGDVDIEAWRARTFPERFSFIQSVRAWGDWLASARKGELALSIHLIAAPVYREIASGRLDVLELLSCQDMRSWAEVHVGAELVERRLFQLGPKTKLRAVVDDLDLPHRGWDVEVQPAPNLLEPLDSDRDVAGRLDEPIYELGVVPGSTLHFRRRGEASTWIASWRCGAGTSRWGRRGRDGRSRRLRPESQFAESGLTTRLSAPARAGGSYEDVRIREPLRRGVRPRDSRARAAHLRPNRAREAPRRGPRRRPVLRLRRRRGRRAGALGRLGARPARDGQSGRRLLVRSRDPFAAAHVATLRRERGPALRRQRGGPRGPRARRRAREREQRLDLRRGVPLPALDG